MEGGDSRKSGRSESDVNGNGALKKLKQGREYLPTGGERKSKPCTEFFSNAGCPFGEKCYFSHHIRDGINPISKSLLCSRYYSAYGCVKNCPYAHGGEELCRPISYKKITSAMGPMAATKFERLLPGTSVYATTVRTSTNLGVARSSVKGMNTWLLNHMSGAKISISNHESDPTMLNIKLEGTLEEVDLATYFVRDQIACAGSSDKPSHHHQTAMQANPVA